MNPDEAVARLPRWMLLLAAAGTTAAALLFGLRAGGGFLLGAAGAWINLKLIVRAVDRIGRLALSGKSSGVAPRRSGVWTLIQLMALVLGAVVILKVSGFNWVAALCGFLVCPGAAMLEILYELATYEHP